MNNEMNSNEPSKAGKSGLGGLRISTKGLSLASNITACNEGMSPLMQRFQRNKNVVVTQIP